MRTTIFRIALLAGARSADTSAPSRRASDFQVSDLPAAAGAPAGEAASVDVESERPLFPFVIAIDNRSGDPTWLAPLPFSE